MRVRNVLLGLFSAVVLAAWLMTCGCLGLNEKRAEKIYDEIAVLTQKLELAKASGDMAAVEKIEAELAKLEAEKVKVEELAANESDSRRLLWLAVLGVITGGIKLAGDLGKKVI